MVAQSVGTSDLINDEGLLEISESLWESLNQDLEKDEIKQLLSDAIEEHNVRMPMIQISEADMMKAFEVNRKPVWFVVTDISKAFYTGYFSIMIT